jgi:hypothetical protein
MKKYLAAGRARPREYRCAACNGPVRKAGTGLGTWSCLNGCPKRHYTVVRRCDSGKEAERVMGKEAPTAAFPVERPIAVKVTLL